MPNCVFDSTQGDVQPHFIRAPAVQEVQQNLSTLESTLAASGTIPSALQRTPRRPSSVSNT